MGVASPPKRMKPASAGKHWTEAPAGLSGVIGDRASRTIGREAWETQPLAIRRHRNPEPGGEGLGVGPAHSSEEAGNARGATHWANAKLVRYADDFVVLARHQSGKLKEFLESKLETWMGLEINRDKTRVVNLREVGSSLDFLGYTFRYDRDLHGGKHRYLNVIPSAKALAREREKLREMTSPRFGWKPIPLLIEELNRHLRGWGNYFSLGYPRGARREINSYVRERLTRHFQRRSQRRYRPPKGVTVYAQLQRFGLEYL